jgi:hypothetical protein
VEAALEKLLKSILPMFWSDGKITLSTWIKSAVETKL